MDPSHGLPRGTPAIRLFRQSEAIAISFVGQGQFYCPPADLVEPLVQPAQATPAFEGCVELAGFHLTKAETDLLRDVGGTLDVVDENSCPFQREELLPTRWKPSPFHTPSDRALSEPITFDVKLLRKCELVPQLDPVLMRVDMLILELELLVRFEVADSAQKIRLFGTSFDSFPTAARLVEG